MSEREFSDEELMAYADGEASPKQRTEIEQAIVRESTIEARVELFRTARAMAKEGMEPLLDAPVPDALAANVQAMIDKSDGGPNATPEDNVVPFARKAWTPLPRWNLPIAASIGLLVGGGLGYLAGGIGSDGHQQIAGLRVAKLSAPSVLVALNSIPSGEETILDGTGDRFRAIATYLDADETLCREFEIDQADLMTAVAVACRQAENWDVEFTVISNRSDDGYAPASSLEALNAYLDAVGAGAAMDLPSEKQALSDLSD